MSIEEFHQLPRKLGWKFEYYGGKAHISPQLSAVVATKLAIMPRSVNAPCEIRPVSEDDLSTLLPAYVAAFRDSIDYCDWKLADIKEAAQKNLQNYFSGRRGKTLPASYVAIVKRKVVGAALINEPKAGKPLLFLLFVLPRWHRHGVANALASAGVNVLYDLGMTELRSRYLLGNQASRHWHHQFGFKDQMDQFLVSANYYYYDNELERHKRLDDLSPEALDIFTQLRDLWHDYLSNMDGLPYSAAAREDFG